MVSRLCGFMLIFGWAFTQAQSQESQKVTIAGTVINSATRQPISGALVIMQPILQGQLGQSALPQRAVTSASGTFSFETEGSVGATLQVSRQGYRSEDNLDTARVVLRGAGLGNTLVRLVQQSVITGRIVNGDGEPLYGLTVEAVRIELVDGRRQLKDHYASKATDDRGEYRLWNLAPGSYYLKVAGRAGMYNPVVSSVVFDQSQDAYGPMYYPSAPSQETAQILRVEPGQTINASFNLEGRKAYQIRGRISNPPPERRLQARLLRGGDTLANRAAVTAATGAFQVADVTPGSYTLQIYTIDDGPVWFGEAPVNVGESDLTGVTVPMNAGVDVRGKIESAGDFAGLPVISVRRLDASAPPGTTSEAMAMLEPDRTRFSLKGLLPGKYEVSVSRYYGEHYVSSILAGTTDVLAEGLTVTPGGTPDLNLVLAPGAGSITGTIEGASPEGGNWSVLVVGRYGLALTYRTELAFGGRFTVSGLAPGEYTLYAWGQESRPFEFRNPSVLSTLSQYATSVKAGGGDTKDVILKPIPKEAIP